MFSELDSMKPFSIDQGSRIPLGNQATRKHINYFKAIFQLLVQLCF